MAFEAVVFLRHKLFSSIILTCLILCMASQPLAATTAPGQQPAGCPTVDAAAFVLYDVGSESVLVGRDYEKALAPASITKVLTVLLALEKLDLADEITITTEMFAEIPNDYTRLGLVEGEIITVADAIAASLLISANDAALALGLKMGQTKAGFARMMNEKAQELGCTASNFTNPYGYADPDHLTSALDMALITSAALKEPLFCQISTQKNMLVQPTNKYAEVRGLPNGNRFIKTTQYAYEPYLGGKTGFTNLSAYTIVAGAKKDGLELVGVILGAPNAVQRYTDLIDLFEFGFSQYKSQKLEAAAYSQVKHEAIGQVNDQLTAQGSLMLIDKAELLLPPYAIITSDCSGQTGQLQVELPQLDLPAKGGAQKISLPLKLVFANGYTAPAGFLEIELLPQPTSSPSTATTTAAALLSEKVKDQEQAAKGAAEKAPYGRYLLIGGLSLVFLVAFLLLVAMIRRDLVKKRRKRPRLI